MKLVKRSHRIIALIVGLVIMGALVAQIFRDGRAIAEARAKLKQEQQQKRIK